MKELKVPQYVLVEALGLNPKTEIVDIDLDGADVIVIVAEEGETQP